MGDEDWKTGVDARLRAIETAIAVDDAIGKNIVARLAKIEDTQTWLVRLILGTLITGLIGVIVAGYTGGI